MMNKYYIYKYVQGNKIIYIGKTNDLKRRLREHSKENKFQNLKNFKIYYFECNNELEMNSFEYFLIIKYHPQLNQTFKNIKSTVLLKEPKWFLYEKNNFNNQMQKNNSTLRMSKEDFSPYEIEINQEDDNNFISISDFCNIKNISKQSVYKCIHSKKKWYKYIRLNFYTQRYEIHKKALEIPTQKDLNKI